MEGPAAVTQTTEPVTRAGLPDLLYGETEDELRAAVRGLFSDRAAWPDVLARTETAETYDAGLWRALAGDLGCAGLLIGEQHGGAAASYREAAVVAEETGRCLAPVPYLGSAVVATAAALAAGDAELLTGLAQIADRRKTCAYEIADCLMSLIGNPDSGQFPSAMQLGQVERIPPVGLDPISRLARNQRRSHDDALMPGEGQLPLNPIAAWSGFIAESKRAPDT